MTAAVADAPRARALPFRSDAYAWYVVGVLCLGQAVSMLDRQVINLLVEPLKADLGISDTQVSLLQGFAFALFYALAAIPIGRWADRHNRRNLIAAGVLVFSAGTFGCGLAAGFVTLFLARLIVGAGEATLTPAGYSILSDYFPRHQLGRAVSFFVGTSYVGSGLALLGLGALLGWLGARPDPVLPIVGRATDWQLAFMLVALPGFAFAALLLTVREPPRSGGSGLPAGVALRDVAAFARSRARALGPVYLGLPLLAAGQFGLNAWVPTFFIRTYGWEASEIGPVFGLMVMTLSTTGVVLGGWLSDRLLARGRQDANLVVPAGVAILAAPFALAFPLVGDASLSLVLLAPVLLLGAMPFGAGSAAIPLLAPNAMRAQLMAVYMLVANLVGAGFGPWAIAFVTDRVLGDPALIRFSLASVVSLITVLGALVVASGRRAFARELGAVVPAPLV